MAEDVFLKFVYDERDVARGVLLRLAGRLRAALPAVVAASVVTASAVAFGPVWGRYAALALLAATLFGLGAAGLWAAPPVMFRAGSPTPPRKGSAGVEPEGFRDPTMTIDASEDGLAVTVGKQLVTIRWDECVRLQTDARTLVLYFGQKGFVVVPRRAFRNERRDAAFRELVVSSMDGARRSPLDGPSTEPLAVEVPALAGVVVSTDPGGDSHRSGGSGALTPQSEPSVGRNDPCPCGSGKKYKKCCLPGAASGGA